MKLKNLLKIRKKLEIIGEKYINLRLKAKTNDIQARELLDLNLIFLDLDYAKNLDGMTIRR